MKKLFAGIMLASLLLANAQGPITVAIPQGIVGNPSTNQVLTQPTGTNFNMVGTILVNGSPINNVTTSINGTSGAFTFTGAGVSCSTVTCTFPGATGVTSINTATGAFTFTGSGVSCVTTTTTTCTFTTGSSGYTTVQINSASLAAQPRLNFSTQFSGANNTGNTSSDISIANSGVTAGTYAYPSSISVLADGRVSAVVSGGSTTPVAKTCGANGCYKIDADGTITEWGVVSAIVTNNRTSSAAITFPYVLPGTSTASLQVSCGGDPDGSGTNSMSCYHKGLTTSGATAALEAGVNIGGSGASGFSNAVPVHWRLTY